jgi:hypothetical protein
MVAALLSASLPGLTRQSIVFAIAFARWMPGSGPGMTHQIAAR